LSDASAAAVRHGVPTERLPAAPVQTPAPPKGTAPIQERSPELIRTVQACLMLMGYDGVVMSGVYSTPTARAWLHYLRSAWGPQWGDVPREMIEQRLWADCTEAWMRRAHETPDF
jgi:hypothetical protein